VTERSLIPGGAPREGEALARFFRSLRFWRAEGVLMAGTLPQAESGAS